MEPFAPFAPPAYRAVLRTQAVLLDLVFARKRRSAVPPEDEIVNWSVNRIGGFSAERVAPRRVEGWVLAQHVARYAWAMARLEEGRVADLGCGTGYGTHLLSWVRDEVVGVDVDQRAIETARELFPAAEFVQADLCRMDALPPALTAVCFEVLEHLHEPERVLEAISGTYPRLLLSFPNPLLNGSHLNPHHVVDWPLGVLLGKLRTLGGRSIVRYHHGFKGATIHRHAHPWHGTWLLDVRF